jgi:hypothetical protein
MLRFDIQIPFINCFDEALLLHILAIVHLEYRHRPVTKKSLSFNTMKYECTFAICIGLQNPYASFA